MSKRVARATLVTGLVVVGLSVVPVGGALAKPSGPGPGNAPNAKLCQKGGWQHLFTSTGDSFTSEEACVSYASGGGTLSTEPPLEQQWQNVCQSAGQTFSDTGTGQWRCNQTVPANFFHQNTVDQLFSICTTAGGTPSDSISGGLLEVDCTF